MSSVQEKSGVVELLEETLRPYRSENWEITRGWLSEGTFGLTYAAFLVETYHYVRHSCSLMARACARLDARHHGDVQTYLAKHASEEAGHERWVLEDLDHLGYDAALVESSPPLAETVNLIGGQLYVIEHMHPIGILGYVYVMESRPPMPDVLDYLRSQFGFTDQIMKFLITHGDADVGHREELASALNTYVKSPVEREAVTTSAITGLANVNRLLLRLQNGDFCSWQPRRIA